MYSSKFKNAGNFATSASLAGLVMALHFAGLQLLYVDAAGTGGDSNKNVPAASFGSSASPESAEKVFLPQLEPRNVRQIETIVVTARRL